MIDWTSVGPSVLASFMASMVEFVEALTIVLAVGVVRGWVLDFARAERLGHGLQLFGRPCRAAMVVALAQGGRWSYFGIYCLGLASVVMTLL